MAVEVAAVLSNPAVITGVVGVIIIVLMLLKYLSSSNENQVVTLPKLGPPPEFKSTDPEIVVIGGGITGATFAARLGMEGRRVVLIERDMGTTEIFRGELLRPGGINAFEEMNMLDVLDDIEKNRVEGEVYFDVRLGGEPGYIHYPKPGALAMRHEYLVAALRKKALAQESVTAIEAFCKGLIKENGRVVGARYRRKQDDEVQEIRAPLVVVGDGFFSKLSAEYRKTHETVSSDLCIGLRMNNYTFKTSRRFIEFGIGHPDSQICMYQLNEREKRAIIFVHGKTPSNLKEFCKKKVVPYIPEHMKEPVMASIEDGLRFVRTKRMAANFDVTPGMLIIGDALNTRHPVNMSGMTVALIDVVYWWKVLTNNVKSLTDDEAILQQKLIFRKERLKYSYVINVFAEILIRLLNDHDASTVVLQQYFIKELRQFAKDDAPQEDKDDLFGVFGLTETKPEVYHRLLDGTVDGAIKEVFKTRSYISAVWESMKIRKKWTKICGDVMKLEAMS